MLQLEIKTSFIKIRAHITATEAPKVGEFFAFHVIKSRDLFHYMSNVLSAKKRLCLGYLLIPDVKFCFEPPSYVAVLLLRQELHARLLMINRKRVLMQLHGTYYYLPAMHKHYLAKMKKLDVFPSNFTINVTGPNPL